MPYHWLVKYGQPIKEYLMQQVTLLHIHRFSPDEVQFEDALVSSAVVWLKKESPSSNHKVKFSYGGTLLKPEISGQVSLDVLCQTTKWTRFPKRLGKVSSVSMPHTTNVNLKLSDLFRVTRGLATGANRFFILTPEQM